MSTKLISMKCPECGASADVEEGRTQIFCSYCGTKIKVENDQEHIYRHIDEAEIKQAETDRLVQLKKMELKEQERISREKARALKIKISIPLGIFMVVAFILGCEKWSLGMIMAGCVAAAILRVMWGDNENEKDDKNNGKIRVPSEISGYQNKNYEAIEALFTSAGFINVKVVPLNDLTIGVLKKPGTVESIAVNGESVFGEERYLPDAAVVISYHSYRDSNPKL